MTPELEKLIDNAIINGEISDRSKELLFKKAEQAGVDPIDFELYLESKFGQKKNLSFAGTTETHSYTTPPQQTSNKEGVIKKCPSCGAPVQSFLSKCSECGHEFRDIKAVSSVQKLNEQLQDVATRIREEREKMVVNIHTSHLKNPLNISKEIYTLQASIIAAFPIPNTKEDLLEFLAISLAGASKKPNKIGPYVLDGSDVMNKTWLVKAEEVIMKARFTLKDDKNALQEVEFYATQLNKKGGWFGSLFK